MATVQLRNPTHGRAHYDRKKLDGKTSTAVRYLRPRPSFAAFPAPCPGAGPQPQPQPQPSAVCLPVARAGAPLTGGNVALLTQRGAK